MEIVKYNTKIIFPLRKLYRYTNEKNHKSNTDTINNKNRYRQNTRKQDRNRKALKTRPDKRIRNERRNRKQIKTGRKNKQERREVARGKGGALDCLFPSHFVLDSGRFRPDVTHFLGAERKRTLTMKHGCMKARFF